MRVVDANVLLYASNSATPHHDDSRQWLDTALGGGDRVGFAWNVLLAFIRISTHHALLPTPLSSADAIAQADLWLSSPNAVLVSPGPAHQHHLSTLLTRTGGGGNLTNDAHLAALSLEHRASIASYDNDFSRFPGVTWHTPSELLARSG
ncbi:type II toxin-antitoxin system VapC family toxin [Rarobacter faecitabidus]|uniref:Ribonuclease VapC n=1 Tax=Rarobacter faecitabidus TaxID=13243 RepID=A0A542ZWT7_RARFA|nr:type II toxin-antitoxin system VapC family toxin [Rarobacter faecitabidus]TQL64823.1 hypothetical protein FB461_1346 [Rarobacter faecitabidus]